ncbi:general stress protein [Desemzia sp. RIT804]|uniref:general stress protein n=1 Tax=Desemzia sp. RIT 804 TaxID=2810209 RepID=UPI0019504FB2|nr:general stress protein [Desemzia sp. RIT 804]MBM6615908.1 general stress protein [Desemzia sp. RIT 804]
MQKRIEGTYQSSEKVLKAVERLLNEGYKGEEIVVITDNNSNHQKELDDLTLIEVESVDPNEGLSFWEKAKEMLSFGNYNVDESNSPLTEYGIDDTEAQAHNEALRNGEILILVNKEMPTNIAEEEDSGRVENQYDESVDQTREEMKEEYETSPGEEEVFDPSKAQSSREDKHSDEVKNEMEANVLKDNEKNKTNGEEIGDIPESSVEAQQASNVEESTSNENKNRLDDEEAPQLTGDETSVTLDEGTHEYPDKINTGYTEGSTEKPAKSPLNAEEKKEKSPSENTERPESDAYYNDEYQDAGGKTIEDDERKK